MGPTSIAFFSYEHRPFPEYDPRQVSELYSRSSLFKVVLFAIQEFARLAAEFNLKVEVVPLAKHHPDFCADDIEIWKVRRGSSPSSELGDEQQPSPGVECAIWGENQPFAQLSVQGRPITIQQNSETGIGGVLWPSSVVACKLLVEAEAVVGRYLASLPAGAAVIDLGAGCGLTSILLSRLGFRVLAMDREAIMPLLRSNLDSNGASAVETLPFDWTAMSGTGESEAVLSKLQSLQPSLVLCSDCLYNSTAVDPLLALLMRLRTKVLIVNEMRTALEEFLYLLRRAPEVKSSSFMLDIQDIDVRDEDLVIVRTESSFISAPPIRAVLINIA